MVAVKCWVSFSIQVTMLIVNMDDLFNWQKVWLRCVGKTVTKTNVHRNRVSQETVSCNSVQLVVSSFTVNTGGLQSTFSYNISSSRLAYSIFWFNGYPQWLMKIRRSLACIEETVLWLILAEPFLVSVRDYCALQVFKLAGHDFPYKHLFKLGFESTASLHMGANPN